MNNLTFGDERYQYYETLCGGAGAGPGWDGCSAVHTHMTNSRLTDPEVLEWRYPVRVEEFRVRTGSGGEGAHRGGDGAVRRLRFLEPLTAAIVSSSRRVPPYGLAGGLPGACGRNAVERADGTVEELPGVAQTRMAPGDVLVVETPGGGGYGRRRPREGATTSAARRLRTSPRTPGEIRPCPGLALALSSRRRLAAPAGAARSSALTARPTRNPTSSSRTSISAAGRENHQKKKWIRQSSLVFWRMRMMITIAITAGAMSLPYPGLLGLAVALHLHLRAVFGRAHAYPPRGRPDLVRRECGLPLPRARTPVAAVRRPPRPGARRTA